MSFPNDDMRPIQYPLNRSQGLVFNTLAGETIDTPFSWQTADNDERVSITLELSLNEYVALASAIDVGRDIAYGDASVAIWWIWIRSVNPMAFCEQVDNCIQTSVTTQTTINNFLLSSGVVNPDQIEPIAPQMDNRFPAPLRQTESSAAPPSCDKGALWAGILAIVQRLDAMGLDFLEQTVASNDKAERIANIIDLVPLFGDIAADVITIFADIAQDIENAYVAHSSLINQEELACKLFELVCEECRYPTFEEIYDLYSSFGITGIQDIANLGLTAAMDYLIGSNNLANSFVWYTMNTVTIYTLYLGGTFLNKRGTKWFGIWAAIGESTPSPAWLLLCDGCDTWCYEWDLTIAQTDWTIVDGALGINGLHTGFYQQTGTDQHGASLNLPNSELYTITQIEMYGLHDVKLYFVGGWNEEYMYSTNLGSFVSVVKSDGINDPISVIKAQSGITGDLKIGIRSGIKATGGAGDISTTGGYISSVILRGTGANPFGIDNCV